MRRWPRSVRSINFDSKRCEGYRNFCNKLWNASRFVLMNCEGQDCGLDGTRHGRNEELSAFSQADRWIVSACKSVEADRGQGLWPSTAWTTSPTRSTTSSGTSSATGTWKSPGADPDRRRRQQRHARRTLIRVLETILRLAHPIIPSSPSAVAKVAPGGRVAQPRRSAWRPTRAPSPSASTKAGRSPCGAPQTVVDACRTLRGEMNVSPPPACPLFAVGDAEFMRARGPVLQALAKLSEVKVLDDEAAWQTAAQAPLWLWWAKRACACTWKSMSQKGTPV